MRPQSGREEAEREEQSMRKRGKTRSKRNRDHREGTNKVDKEGRQTAAR